MPTVRLNKKVFENLVGKKLPIEKLKERISYLGTDLEDIKGNEITVEVFPNRPDMLSEQGFARAFSSFIGKKTGLRRYYVNTGLKDYRVKVDPSVNKVRPYTVCAIAKNLNFDDNKIKEIVDIQEKLHITYGRNRKKAAIGIYPLEHISLPITYLAKKPREIRFRPLEMKAELNAKQILEKHPAGKSYGHLLNNHSTYPIFVDAKDEILSMPPIVNSHITGKVTKKTKEVFIEVSGHDLNTVSTCLNILVTALADMGAKIYDMEISYSGKKMITPNLDPGKMKLNVNNVNNLLGLNLNKNEVSKYLRKMGYEFNGKEVLVPCYRADVIHEVDIIEDIAIAYGLENFTPEIPNITTISEEDKFSKFREKIAELMTGFNLIEINSYNITNVKDLNGKMNVRTDFIHLDTNSDEYNVLRTWITPSLLKVLSNNKHNEYPQRIFEVGTNFIKDNKEETRVNEIIGLAMLSCHSKADYTEARQIMDALLNTLNLSYTIKEIDHPSFISGRGARINVNGKNIADIGEIHPKVLANFHLEMPVCSFELNLSELFKLI